MRGSQRALSGRSAARPRDVAFPHGLPDPALPAVSTSGRVKGRRKPGEASPLTRPAGMRQRSNSALLPLLFSRIRGICSRLEGASQEAPRLSFLHSTAGRFRACRRFRSFWLCRLLAQYFPSVRRCFARSAHDRFWRNVRVRCFYRSYHYRLPRSARPPLGS